MTVTVFVGLKLEIINQTIDDFHHVVLLFRAFGKIP
jgi:hypothetical protein